MAVLPLKYLQSIATLTVGENIPNINEETV
jgi:hypothetical protein